MEYHIRTDLLVQKSSFIIVFDDSGSTRLSSISTFNLSLLFTFRNMLIFFFLNLIFFCSACIGDHGEHHIKIRCFGELISRGYIWLRMELFCGKYLHSLLRPIKNKL